MGVTTSRITRVIGVADMKRAIGFYTGALGLVVERESEGWTDLTTANGNLALQLHPAQEKPTPTMVIFTVADREAAIAAIEQAGGTLLRRVDNDQAPVILAHVTDTENNVIQLAQPR